MCKYCNSKEYTIIVRVDKWLEEEKRFKPDTTFEVKYCPMCGEKLDKDDEQYSKK